MDKRRVSGDTVLVDIDQYLKGFHNPSQGIVESKVQTNSETVTIEQDEIVKYFTNLVVTRKDIRRITLHLPQAEAYAIGGVPKSSTILGGNRGVIPLIGEYIGWETYRLEMFQGITLGWKSKSISSIILATLSWISGFSTVHMFAWFTLVAVLDFILGAIPGNQKPGKEADYKLKARFFQFLTFCIAIVAAIAIRKALGDAFDISDVVSSISAKIVSSIDRIAIGMVFSIYAYRIILFIIRSSRSKTAINMLPDDIKKAIRDDV